MYSLLLKDVNFAKFAYSKCLVENSIWYDDIEDNCYIFALYYSGNLSCLVNVSFSGDTIHVNMIESVDVNMGSGKVMLKLLFEEAYKMTGNVKTSEMHGDALAQAFRFWKGMGACINLSEEEVEEAIEDETGLYPFSLSYKDFVYK